MTPEELTTEVAALIEDGTILGAGYRDLSTLPGESIAGEVMLPDRALVPFTLTRGTLTIGGGPHDSIAAWLNGSAR